MNKNDLLSKLYIEKANRIASFIKSRIYSDNHDDVEDCLQEVYLIAVSKSMTTDVENHPNIMGWLYNIAHYVVKRFNRNYIKTKYNIDKEIDLHSIADNADFTEQIITENFLTQTLSKEEKDLVIYRAKGLTQKEISLIINISENAVKSRLKRIKQKLRQS